MALQINYSLAVCLFLMSILQMTFHQWDAYACAKIYDPDNPTQIDVSVQYQSNLQDEDFLAYFVNKLWSNVILHCITIN